MTGLETPNIGNAVCIADALVGDRERGHFVVILLTNFEACAIKTQLHSPASLLVPLLPHCILFLWSHGSDGAMTRKSRFYSPDGNDKQVLSDVPTVKPVVKKILFWGT